MERVDIGVEVVVVAVPEVEVVPSVEDEVVVVVEAELVPNELTVKQPYSSLGGSPLSQMMHYPLLRS